MCTIAKDYDRNVIVCRHLMPIAPHTNSRWACYIAADHIARKLWNFWWKWYVIGQKEIGILVINLRHDGTKCNWWIVRSAYSGSQNGAHRGISSAFSSVIKYEPCHLICHSNVGHTLDMILQCNYKSIYNHPHVWLNTYINNKNGYTSILIIMCRCYKSLEVLISSGFVRSISNITLPHCRRCPTNLVLGAD